MPPGRPVDPFLPEARGRLERGGAASGAAKTGVIHHALDLLLTAHLRTRSSIADFALQLPLAKLI